MDTTDLGNYFGLLDVSTITIFQDEIFQDSRTLYISMTISHYSVVTPGEKQEHEKELFYVLSKLENRTSG